MLFGCGPRSHAVRQVIFPTDSGGVPRFSGTVFQVRLSFSFLSGGLRYAATTGYSLTAFQAETHPLVAVACFNKAIRRLLPDDMVLALNQAAWIVPSRYVTKPNVAR